MWKLKLLIQFILSLIPFGEKLNYLLQQVNGSHSDKRLRGRLPGMAEAMMRISQFRTLEGAAVMEIGTGWVPIGSTLLYLMGAETIYTYDHVPHLRFAQTQKLVTALESEIVQISNLSGIPLSTLECRLMHLKKQTSLTEWLSAANIVYTAPGDASNTNLPDNSVDLVFSHGVLGNVPEKLIKAFTLEAQRILRPGGVVYHYIGTGDVFSGFDRRITKVNFLKYPEPVWAFFAHNKIIYYNRLRAKQYLDIFAECGAQVVEFKTKVDPSDIDALKNMVIDRKFHGMSHEELAVNRSEVILMFS